MMESFQQRSAMSAVLRHIRSLESYVERSGARLVRAALPEWVHGRVFSDLITLQADLNPEQQLLALVHELAHWLAHRDMGCPVYGVHCTIYEYEAEAVEAVVMARLGLPHPTHGVADPHADPPTDGLLSSSVTRVVSTSRRICQALGLPPG
jgi:hypothetical protein